MPPKGARRFDKYGPDMITTFRKFLGSRWGAAIALAFVILMGFAFALGDVTGSGNSGGLGGNQVAKVGSRKISLNDFQTTLDRAFKREREDNPALDMAAYVDSGGFDSVLNQLIDLGALAEFGEKYGIGSSKRLIDSEIRRIPAVNGPDGNFSQPAFEAFLRAQDLTDAKLRDDLRLSFYARQILPVAGAGAPPPQSLVLPYASLLLEKRAGEVALIPAQAFLPTTPPTDVQLQGFYRTNAARFTIPEKRAISYAIFDASIVDAKAQATDADIGAYYKANAQKYAATQTRDISQLVFPTEAAAKAAAAKIAGGQSFEAVARELKLSATSANGVARDALAASASKPVADAVFAATQGAIAAPARGGLGWYVVRVNRINQVAVRPLAVVSAEIAKTIAADKKNELLSDLTTEVQDEFAGGATITDMAKNNGLKVETTPLLFANGQNPANPSYKPVPEMARILQSAFELDNDGEAELIEIVPGEKFAMVSVASLEEAAPPLLSAVRDQIVAQWALAEGDNKAKSVAEQVQRAVLGGKSLADAMASTGARLPPTQRVAGSRIDLNREGQRMPPPLAMMFAMKKGTAKTLAAGQGQGWFVVNLDEVIKGDASGNKPLVDARRGELLELLQQEYAAQLITAARAELKVSKNDSALKALRDRLTNRNVAQ